MHPDDFADDPFLDEEDGTDLAYDDGFGEPLFLDEADELSARKGREKTRRGAIRKDTRRVKDSARRGNMAARRNRMRTNAGRLAQLRWQETYLPLIQRLWPSFVPAPLTPPLVAVMHNAYLMQVMALVNTKADGVREPGDAVSLVLRSALAAALSAAARRSGRIGPKQEQAFATALRDGLKMAEQVIRVAAQESDEPEDWECEDWEHADGGGASDDPGSLEVLDEDWEEFDDEAARAPRGAAAASSADLRRCAEALRRSARYLLRVERQLMDAGKR